MRRPTIVALVLVALVSLTGAGCQEGVGGGNGTGTAPGGVPIVDLNRASVRELESLPAIGTVHARSIIASRNARGGRFRRLEDLLEIDGIGKKTLDAIRPYVVVGP
jgi:competence protein ComEA